MNDLEKALQDLKGLTNKGYQVEQVQCAALMLIAQALGKLEDVVAEEASRGGTG